MENIKEYVEPYATFGKPVKYEDIELKPVKLCDYFKFMRAIHCLRIQKNKTPDINIIQMSYLAFLINYIAVSNDVKQQFIDILSLCFGLERDEKFVVNNPNFKEDELLVQQMPNDREDYYINGWDVVMHLRTKSAEIEIGGHSFNSSQFDDLRKIILYQNLSDYDDIEMSADFERVLEDFYRLKNKGIHHPSLEEKRMAVTTNSPYSLESLDALPIRTFDKMFESVLMKIDYMATKSLEPHLKDGHVEHWVYYHEKDKFSDIFTDVDSVAKKVTSV